MRFSLLLPTRNGGKFLQHTIDSVLGQEFQDLELVIYDNASDPETQEIISSASRDPRVRAARFENLVTITENWMATLRRSSGEYLLLLGDDDSLLPGTLLRLERTLRRYEDPDCILYNGYSYVYPGSIHSNPVSYYSLEHFRFGSDFSREMRITRELRESIVADMFRFRARIPLNMQTALVKRSAIEKVRGDFFQPPFPDHWALNSLLLTSGDWIFTPERLVVVGVSPKSYGHYFYSNELTDGRSYLGIEPVEDTWALPGGELLNNMYRWLLLLQDTYPERGAERIENMFGWSFPGLIGISALLMAPYSGSMNQGDEQAIRNMVDQAISRLNAGDVSAFDDFWDENADDVGVDGTLTKGRTQIQVLFRQMMKSGTGQQTVSIEQIRFITQELATVDGSWTVTGVRDVSGKKLPPVKGRGFELVQKNEGRWVS